MQGTDTHTYTHKRLHTRTHTHTYVNIQTHAYSLSRTRTRQYLHTHTYPHSRTHTRTHTYTLALTLFRLSLTLFSSSPLPLSILYSSVLPPSSRPASPTPTDITIFSLLSPPSSYLYTAYSQDFRFSVEDLIILLFEQSTSFFYENHPHLIPPPALPLLTSLVSIAPTTLTPYSARHTSWSNIGVILFLIQNTSTNKQNTPGLQWQSVDSPSLF